MRCSRPSADPAWASYCTGSPVCLCVETRGHGGQRHLPTPAFSLENTDEHPDLREHRQKRILANLELVSENLWLLWFELWFWSLMDHTVDCSLHLNHPSIRSSNRDISVSSSAKCFTSWSILSVYCRVHREQWVFNATTAVRVKHSCGAGSRNNDPKMYVKLENMD